MRVAAAVVAIAALGGCVRDPAAAVCPKIDAGALVITELRGPQRPDDGLGPWLELYNATGDDVDLAGTRVRFRRLDGSSEVAILVRRDVPVVVGGYAVLGLVDDATAPPHVDYGFAADFHQAWLAAAAVDVEACGVRIDRAIYDALPQRGTYSLGGPPDADANDLPATWCTDAAGTPQQPNAACPAARLAVRSSPAGLPGPGSSAR